MPPTTITNLKEIQTFSEDETNPSVAPTVLLDKSQPTQDEEHSTRSVTEQDTVTKSTEPTTKEITSTNTKVKVKVNTYATTSKISVDTNPTKLVVKTTTKSPGSGQATKNGAQPRRDDTLFEGNHPN